MNAPTSSPEHPHNPVAGRLQSLTPRQMQVCELVVEGLTNKEIAERLDITVHTVKVHRAEVMRQMGVESVAELVRAVMAPQPTEGGSPLIDVARPLRIIVVEDQDLLRQLMTRSLNQFGHHAVGVRNGYELADEWARGPADILVIDIELGTQENGLDLTARFRKENGCGVIIVSAHGRTDDRIAGLERGADAFFVKPVSFKELHAAVTNLGKRLRKG
ncbi:response regulator [uncultured Aquabacterium sp.]|uniref:response regulator n=1 Tax=Aquabacterium sp. TaxID=1872578 RepID=UPI0025DF425A|nr:response regulator [uncultured Aquabacterium sp.]